ncbi:hypothetical protein TRVA0_003S00496 [Trichomonascus vanleenenianus]|uniref:putative polyadenylation protein n=1 Tax=Trichomonascus vanleenenianus TaxID=2268995 RepID=UPI003ECB77F4
MAVLRYLAEYLARIRSVALSIEVEDGLNVEQLVFQSTEKAIVHYTKDGESHTAEIVLPEQVSASVAERIYSTDVETKTLSYRFPASPELLEHSKPMSFLDNPNVRMPWPASELNSQEWIQVVCGGCSTVIIKAKRITRWQQLPSEHWAEMMDFWHCHKPDEGHDHFNPNYAVNRFVPKTGVGMVGMSYFLICPGDIVNTALDKGMCVNCSRRIGSADYTDTFRLWKWSVRLESPGNGMEEQYPYHYYVSSTVAQLIDTHAMYTFYVEPEQESSGKDGLLLWVFNPDIKYTLTGAVSASRGFKVFYSTDWIEIPGLRQTRAEIEEVMISPVLYEHMIKRLRDTTALLPNNARKFGKWDVGLLDRL